TVFPPYGVHGDIPDLRGASLQLIADVFGCADDRHARRVAHPTAAGQVGVAAAVGVANTRPHTFDRDSELLGHHDRLRRARAADIRIPGDDRGAAVGVEDHRGARIHAGVEPEADRNPASLIR